MPTRAVPYRLIWIVGLTLAALALAAPCAIAQNNNGNNNNNNNNLLGNVGGVLVDADGVVRMKSVADPTGQLHRERLSAARSSLDPKLAARSALRKVSLTRLEAVLAEKLAAGAQPNDEMRYLAGLTRIQFVFFYPETNDIVLAGPAEGFAADLSGRVRGIESGQPVLQLGDLIVALRAFFGPSAQKAPLISVSIDPTQEGLANMQRFLQQVGSRATPAQTQFITNGLRESLGLQMIRLTGVPASSHFSQVLVEADYRMKLIGIGLESPGIKMASWVDRANPAAVRHNALQRWYFVPDYDCLRVSEDEMAVELVGNGVKLISADELVASDGSLQQSGTVDAASRAFTEAFTRNYAAIARQSPVFTELRNIIDLSIAAAYIAEHKLAQKADWKMPTFLNEKSYAVETLNVPKQVESAVASVWRGRTLMTPIGGGVRIQPRKAIDNAKVDLEGTVSKARDAINLSNLPAGQWWWD
jgi:Protein of unknown function (DUF1598)